MLIDLLVQPQSKMIKSEINIRVLYAHTDNMDIGNNGSYIEYMEEF